MLACTPCFWPWRDPNCFFPIPSGGGGGNSFFSLCFFFSWNRRRGMVIETRAKPMFCSVFTNPHLLCRGPMVVTAWFWHSRVAAAPKGCRDPFSTIDTGRTQQCGGTRGNWEPPSTSQPCCPVLRAQDLGFSSPQCTLGCTHALREGFWGLKHCSRVPARLTVVVCCSASGWGQSGRGWHIGDITDPHFLSGHRAPRRTSRVCTEPPQPAPSPIRTP